MNSINNTMSEDGEEIPLQKYDGVVRECWMFTLWHPTQVDHDVVVGEQALMKKLVFGKEICPKTKRPHAHVVIEWKTPVAFDEMVQWCNVWYGDKMLDDKGKLVQRWGKLKYNQKPHAFIRYASKGDDVYKWDYRDVREPGIQAPRALSGRDERAVPVLDRAEEPGAMMRDLWNIDRTFYFWNRRHILEYLQDMRAFARNQPDGEEPRVNF